MTANESNDSRDEKPPGTTRRRFIGAISALAGLTGLATTASGQHDQNTAGGRKGNQQHIERSRESEFSASLDVWSKFQEPADYDVQPSKLEDEEIDVSLRVHFENAQVNVAFTKSEAEAFAAELVAAAERGEKGLGELEVDHTAGTEENDGSD